MQTVRVSRKGQLMFYTEKQEAELFSSSNLSPDLCSTCRGVLLKGAVLLRGGKNIKDTIIEMISQKSATNNAPPTYTPLSLYDVPH